MQGTRLDAIADRWLPVDATGTQDRSPTPDRLPVQDGPVIKVDAGMTSDLTVDADGTPGGDAPQDAGPAVPLVIQPASARLAPGERAAFSASEEVIWSLPEGSRAGRIGPDGVFEALGDRGVFTVLATSIADASRSALATVSVWQPGELEYLTGFVGGPGSLDGPLVGARLFGPRVLPLGPDQLLVAENGNHTIRRIDLASGTITTLAGFPFESGNSDGIGSVARFNGPWGMALDGAGGVYIADGSNDLIRHLDLTTLEVTTVAGGGMGPGRSVDGIGRDARFASPTAIAMVPPSTLYVADSQGPTIRRIDLVTTEVTTVAGRSLASGNTDGVGTQATFNWPIGLVVVGDSLFVAEASNCDVRRIDLATADVTTFAGHPGSSGYYCPFPQDGVGTSAAMGRLLDLSYDGAGHLLALDAEYSTVRYISLDTAEVSSPLRPLTCDGCAYDYTIYTVAAAGSLAFVGDNGRLMKVDLTADPPVTVLAGSERFASGTWGGTRPYRTNIDLTGITATRQEAHVTAAGAAEIVAVSLATREGHPVYQRMSFDDPFRWPAAIARQDDGTFYVTSSFGGDIFRILPGLQATRLIDDLEQPAGIGLEPSGRLLVVDSRRETVERVDPGTGGHTLLAGSPGTSGSADGTGAEARFTDPRALATDGATVFVADYFNATIRKIDLGTLAVTTLAGSPGTRGTADGVGAAALFRQPASLALSGTTLYVGDRNTVRAVDVETATVSTLVGDPARYGVLPGPRSTASLSRVDALAVNPDGDLLIIDGLEQTVLVLRPDR